MGKNKWESLIKKAKANENPPQVTNEDESN